MDSFLQKQIVLECQALHKSYQEGPQPLVVLDGVDFSIRSGERVAIVGASGAGKSTLLNMLGGLDIPTSGDVIIAGQAIASMNEKQRGQLRNRYLGFVYQFHHLLPEFTALENIMLPQQSNGKSAFEARRQAIKLLDQVGLADRKDHRPGELSGGEQQRVAFCRALSNSPKLLLADEPTGNLDQETSEHVFGILMELVHSTGMAALIATHNLHLASRMDRNVVLDKGKVT